ncbi:HesA/MoeB/ThiF family protein [Alteromonas confluentis]|uniref:Molybdopterin-synthase adenylyltransferase MoeB n=1 Tax=Alteromonas confluentis TaxID=1656094 RepID=A0A1E7ZBH8_9ALTE|nr:molybdopterin-synthase adenylyltransferase MoeB [Alteromonas confluentis]OFC70875.1 molybdopterin-synthase adenylyltransferase MoeB [Alteromonas confluentis]
MPDTLTHTQAMRYNRHIVLPQFDIDGQEKLLNARILLIGMGGLGNAVAQSLAAGGVGALTLIDDDKVEQHNLPRQILFTDADCGQFKVDAARSRLGALAPDCRITPLRARLSDEALLEQASQHDIIVDCTDNLASRRQINQVSVQAGIPLISGAAIRFEGQLFVSVPGDGKACYGCVEKRFHMAELSCNEAGILSPVVSMIGIAQAHLVMQCLSGFGTLPTGELQLFDGLNFQWQKFKVSPHPACDICNNTAE